MIPEYIWVFALSKTKLTHRWLSERVKYFTKVKTVLEFVLSCIKYVTSVFRLRYTMEKLETLE